MSKDLNQCNFIGRLGRDPDVKFMPSGKAVVNFSIACGDDYKDKQSGQKVEKTNWINVVAFDRLAEVIGEYLKKGSKVYVTGKQVTRKWQDNTGADRYTTEIVANDMQMLDSRQDGGEPLPNRAAQQGVPAQQARAQNQQQGQPNQPAGFDNFDDDIPF